jgi:hypothetical protein
MRKSLLREPLESQIMKSPWDELTPWKWSSRFKHLVSLPKQENDDDTTHWLTVTRFCMQTSTRPPIRSPSSNIPFGKAPHRGQLATFVLADRCILLLHPQHRMWDPGGSMLNVNHRRSWRNGETSETTRGRGGQLATFVLAHQCILLSCPQHWMWDPGGRQPACQSEEWGDAHQPLHSVLQWSNDCIWKLNVLNCRRMNGIHCIWKWSVSDCGIDE